MTNLDDKLREILESSGPYAGDLVGDVLIPQLKQAFAESGWLRNYGKAPDDLRAYYEKAAGIYE